MTTFAYLADVFVLPSYQRRGLGEWFVGNVLMRAFDTQSTNFERAGLSGNPHSVVKDTRMRFLLYTSTAISFYKRYANFELVPDDEYMGLQIGK
jgi:GNAT superfamily N-acetyltransferase